MREERRETGGVSEEWSAYRLVVVEEERAVVLLRHLLLLEEKLETREERGVRCVSAFFIQYYR